MKNKLMLLAAGALALVAFAALPAGASAGEWGVHTAANKFPTFTIHGANPELVAAGLPKVKCTTVTGTGAYNAPVTTKATTGNITLKFEGCTESFTGSSCTSIGDEATPGVITVSNKVFHNVHLEPNTSTPNTEKIGILITGGADDFATFHCKPFNVTTEITVTGDVIGEVTKPTCAGAATTTGTVVFANKGTASSPTQTWEQVTTTGTNFDLVADSLGSGHTAAQVGSGTITFNEAVTATCV